MKCIAREVIEKELISLHSDLTRHVHYKVRVGETQLLDGLVAEILLEVNAFEIFLFPYRLHLYGIIKLSVRSKHVIINSNGMEF